MFSSPKLIQVVSILYNKLTEVASQFSPLLVGMLIGWRTFDSGTALNVLQGAKVGSKGWKLW